MLATNSHFYFKFSLNVFLFSTHTQGQKCSMYVNMYVHFFNMHLDNFNQNIIFKFVYKELCEKIYSIKELHFDANTTSPLVSSLSVEESCPSYLHMYKQALSKWKCLLCGAHISMYPHVCTCTFKYICIFIYLCVYVKLHSQSCFCELDEISRSIQLQGKRIHFILFEWHPQIRIRRGARMRVPDKSGKAPVNLSK